MLGADAATIKTLWFVGSKFDWKWKKFDEPRPDQIWRNKIRKKANCGGGGTWPEMSTRKQTLVPTPRLDYNEGLNYNVGIKFYDEENWKVNFCGNFFGV
jgi:hypothetical protein